MNSRWSNSPIKRKGQIVSIRPNVVGDTEILKYFGTHGVGTADDLAAYTGRSYGAIIARFNLLKRKPVELIQVHNTQLREPRIHQWSPQVFHLTPLGADRLRELGFEPVKKPSAHFIHAITESQVAASFEIGARLKGLEYVRLEQTPVPVTFSWKGHTYTDHNLTPDLGPIGIGYGNDFWRFCCVEVDCASEPLESSNRDRQAIETKMAAYLTVLEQGLYEKHWGIPKLFVLFTTTTETRMNNMRRLLHDMSTKYLHYFGFMVFPTILSASLKPPYGWAVTVPWSTVSGHLNLGDVHG